MKTISDKLLEIIPRSLSYDSDCVTFFENSNGLNSDGAANNLRNFLIENKIRHNVVCFLDGYSDNQLEELVKNTLDGVIAFETTGLGNSFKKLVETVIRYSNNGYRFKIIECVIDKPVIGFIPNEAAKDLKAYSLYCFDEKIEDWELEKKQRERKK